MSDSLSFDMSLTGGDEKDSVPYLKKEMIYINDNNTNKIYNTNEVVFDSLSFGSNGRWVDYRNGYLVLPIVISLSGNYLTDNAGTYGVIDWTNATNACTDFCLGLKNSNLQLISSLQLEYGNSQVLQTQGNLNQYLIFKQHTSLSDLDEALNGSLIGVT